MEPVEPVGPVEPVAVVLTCSVKVLLVVPQGEVSYQSKVLKTDAIYLGYLNKYIFNSLASTVSERKDAIDKT